MNSEGQKGVKNVFLWAVNTIMLYLGPNEVTGLKKSKQFLLVVRSLCPVYHIPEIVGSPKESPPSSPYCNIKKVL